MKLIWNDEFDEEILDTTKWSYERGFVRNHELQYYTDDGRNIAFRKGCLVILGKKESCQGAEYTSASIHTKGKAEFLYGRIEMRAKLPSGQGIWPAFWTLGADIDRNPWPQCGEIDMMEMIGGKGDDTVYATLHYPNSGKTEVSHTYQLKGKVFCDDFHIFGIDWTPREISWYVDDVVYHRSNIENIAEFHKKHYLLLNLAIGGDWPGKPDENTVFPQEYQIDWVRYYQ